MLDKIKDFATKNPAITAIAAVLGGLVLYSANDKGGGGANPLGPFGGGGGGGRHEVIDQSGFERPVQALTIGVPQGWQAQSEVRWNNTTGQCSAGIASPYIRMTAPDGREQIEILPGYLVTSDLSMITNRGTQPGDFCVVGIADSGESLIRNVAAPRLRNGARIDRIVAVPLTAEQQQAKAQFEQMMRSSGSGRADVYSLEAWLTHPDGSAEVLAVAGYLFAYPQIIAGVPPIVFNSTDSVLSVRSASPDRVPALLQTARELIAGVQFNQEWKAQIEETQRVVTTPVSSRGGRGGGGGGGGFDMDRWREEQRRDDRQQRDRIDTIREVERCYDPETGTTYEVSIHVGC